MGQSFGPWRVVASFPAVVDTGHSHNFSIREEQLVSWTGLSAREIRTIGHARVNKRLVELKDASIAVYPNTPGRRDVSQEKRPSLLVLPEGIAVHGVGDPFAPRLPLLGMRALAVNRLLITIDGGQKEVSLALAAMLPAEARTAHGTS